MRALPKKKPYGRNEPVLVWNRQQAALKSTNVPFDVDTLRRKMQKLNQRVEADAEARRMKHFKSDEVETVQPSPMKIVTPIVTPPAVKRAFDPLYWATLSVAIALATIAAYFSVSGMARIFPGAIIAITIMAAIMEAGKLAGVAWLSRNWKTTTAGWRYSLMCLVSVLALINAAGVFGQLSAAHRDPQAEAITTVDVRSAEIDARIASHANSIADINRRIAIIDSTIEEKAKRGRGEAAMAISAGQQGNRADLVRERERNEGEMVLLRTAQAKIMGERRQAAVNAGVLEYAAKLFHIDPEWMVVLLCAAMTLSCDGLAITLVGATGRRRT